MKLWTAKNQQTGKLFAAASDPQLREKIYAASSDHPGLWNIEYGETPTDKARVLELIEGMPPLQSRESQAVYEVRDGKVAKVREKGK